MNYEETESNHKYSVQLIQRERRQNHYINYVGVMLIFNALSQISNPNASQ